MDHPHAIGGQPEPFAHQVAEIAAGRDEQVHLRRPFGQRPPARRAMALGQSVEEEVFALQGARDRGAQLGLEPARHADQQRVGQGKARPASAGS